MPRAPQRLLGVDYGRVRIGVATCDELGISTRPLGFVPRESDAKAAVIIAELARRERVAGVVIGLPLHANGDAGGNVRWVRDFLKELAKVCTLPVHEVDERYSSSEAEEALKEEGKWPATKGQVDAKSAAILLRRWLNGEE
ncbi:MAG: Holliday junction resolvase RuvX [Planctomycetes bacterium]|nr:Holliday junction resolvase RuvX [Planctomycetota bacterium]